MNIEDDNVWKSIQENTDLIFQVSGNFGSQTIGKIFSEESKKKIFGSIKNFSRMDLFSFTNALLRPCGKSVYNDAVNGIAHVTNIEQVDALLGSELGYPLFQETQMEFVMKFCGYSFLDADHLRKCIARGTMVTMADGTLKPIEDVCVGDRVIGFDGKVFSGQNVLKKWNNGLKKVVEVKLEEGLSIKCTKDHKVLTQDGWKEAGDLSKQDCIYSPRNIICDSDNLRSNQKLSNEVLNGDFVCIPVVSVEEKDDLVEVYDIEVENTHNFVANNIVVHNCIAKKIGTREELPIIENAFNEHAKKDLNLTDEQSNIIIKPFLQCVLDATRYSFCRIHAYSYSYIGYICAYLRYYYPIEYLTACMDVWKDKEDKTKEAIEYARKINVKILEPKFRHGQSSYSFDKKSNSIYKGMLSIKYLNKDCSDGLYLFRNNEYKSFSELLYEIYHNENCKINSKQLEILIKLDFFSEFGNSNELLKIYNMFQSFKFGNAKSISKSKFENSNVLYSIIKRNSSETEKTFTKLNTVNIINECEEYIKLQKFPDIPIRQKAEIQKEYLGYINIITGKEEDRPKVLVLDKKVMIAKTGKNAGKPWCVSIEAQSIGSGKKTKYSIYYNVYQKDIFSILDMIKIKKWSKKNEYFYIDSYEKIF